MDKKILSVSLLNQYIKNIIEGDPKLCNVVVQGEITNLTKHYTGHYYFSIKDENSKISCMMFSSNVKNLKYEINNGDLVLIYGFISVYEKTGSYQLYARYMEPFGLGQELLRIEELKKKLKAEGVFDLPKKPIPKYPKKIALVTSSTGAAVHDFIHTIQSRWNVEIYVFPCLVQGTEAPESIVKALSKADSYGVDTIILGRGGGANEDLSAFNQEIVVRAVINAKTPIISAIGHQIDSSVTDLVSDFACITPTEAGVKATPDKEQLIKEIDNTKEYLNSLINRKIDLLKQQLLVINASKGLISPLDKLKLELLDLHKINEKMTYLMNNRLSCYQSDYRSLNSRLNSLNPFNILNKGYSLVYNENNDVIVSIDELSIGEDITVNMKDGKVIANIKEKMEDKR